MGFNRKYLLIRIVTFPVKIVFLMLWSFVFTLLISFQWLKYGGQELIYGEAHDSDICELIMQNKKILEYLQRENPEHNHD